MRREIWSGIFRTSLHMTLPEPQRGKYPTPEKYISIMDFSPLGQINKSIIKLTKLMAYEEMFARRTVGI